ncbi:mfs multidrug transporter [Diplodia corticola]|uniref:Mfs multidrug transporter n=1 Tax=Diplodia corticola TaxID=236234 RepID=A0A1J9RE34_9PEZI|nr:mfs multidrug transporter [Diplodia corticola]OJD38800.1 mfs multidrug transporter [Diplodia corticola]
MAATGDTGTRVRSKGRFRFVMAFSALSIVAFSSAFDATILGNALPVIAEDVGATSLESFWMTISFMLASVALQPVHTAFSDIFGRKPVLFLCCVLFTAGLIVFGLARSPAAIITGRTIQGMGGGGLEALSEVILTDLTTLKERPLYLGILSFFWATAGAVGPPVGGALAQYASWRWLAWINLPFMGIAMVLIPLFLTLQQDRSSASSKLRRVDWIGIALFIAAVTLLLVPLTCGGNAIAWNSAGTIVSLVIGGSCLVLFVFAESRAQEPMMPPRVINTPMLAATMLGSLLHGIAMWCILYYAPLFFESVFGHDPLQSAVDGFSFAFTATPAAILTAFLIDAVRRYLWGIALGWTLATSGAGAMTLLAVDASVTAGRALLVPAGLGLGMLYPALAMPVQPAVGADLAGVATGTLCFFRSLGMTLGLAIGSAVFSNRFAALLRDSGLADLDGFDSGARDAVGFIPHLREHDLSPADLLALRKVYAASFRSICVALSVVAGVGLLATVFIKDMSIESEDEGRQAFQTEAITREDTVEMAQD